MAEKTPAGQEVQEDKKLNMNFMQILNERMLKSIPSQRHSVFGKEVSRLGYIFMDGMKC